MHSVPRAAATGVGITAALVFVFLFSCSSQGLSARRLALEGPNMSANMSAAPSKSNYVLGAAFNLPLQSLNVFIRSWRRFSPSTKIVLFVNEKELIEKPDFAALLQDFSVLVEIVPPANFSMLFMQRIDAFQKFVEKHIDTIDGVVLADVKDSAIQADPFANPTVMKLVKEERVLFSLEGGPKIGDISIAEEPSTANSNWIVECFGPETLKLIGNKTVVCSGIILGAARAVSDLAALIVDVHSKALPTCRTDQGVLNYILHVMVPAGAVSFKHSTMRNIDSPVYTVGYGYPIHMDQYQQVRIVGSGFFPPIVHQYNRFNDITYTYEHLYPITETRILTF